jgi:hypothetical protein
MSRLDMLEGAKSIGAGAATIALAGAFDCPIREWKFLLIHGFAWKTTLPLFKLGRSRKHT